MSCTVSPVTKTSPGELRKIRSSLEGAYNGLKSRTTVSSNMRRAVSNFASAAVHRGTQLTLPFILTSPAEKLEAAGNTLLYTLKETQSFKITAHLPLQYASVTNTLETIIMYSTVQNEGKKQVRYAVVAILKTGEVSTPSGTEPARPDTIPLCPIDADFHKSILPAAVESVAGVASSTKNTVVFSFFKSTDGEKFTPHNVTKYGWKIPSGTDPEKLLLVGAPDAQTDMSYPINEERPYGNFYKKIRPAGYKPEWGRVAAKEYSLNIMVTEIPRAVDICAAALGLTGIEGLKSGIVNGSTVTLRYESGALLYLPTNRFDIRPQKGAAVHRKNIVDPGPFPRRVFIRKRLRKEITAGYRPVGSKFYSAGGNYQYIQETWEAYSKRYAAMFGVTTGFKWLWEAPPQAQAWYQAAYATEYFYKYTQQVLDVFPPFYYAIMIHANNIGNAMAQKFLVRARNAIIQDRNANPGYNVTAAHITCKRVYEEKSWLILKHSAYMNRVLSTLKRELPLIDPVLYPNNLSLYPKST